MTDAIIWLAAMGLVVLMFWSLIHEQNKRTRMTDEEYQQRAKEEPGLISTGMMAFDQSAFRPQAKAAIEYQKDKMTGQTEDLQKAGDDIWVAKNLKESRKILRSARRDFSRFSQTS